MAAGLRGLNEGFLRENHYYPVAFFRAGLSVVTVVKFTTLHQHHPGFSIREASLLFVLNYGGLSVTQPLLFPFLLFKLLPQATYLV